MKGVILENIRFAKEQLKAYADNKHGYVWILGQEAYDQYVKEQKERLAYWIEELAKYET